MSSITLAPTTGAARTRSTRTTSRRAPARTASAAPVRLTRRGRVVFVAVAMLIFFGAMVALAGFATATHRSGTQQPVRIVEVQPGDTLYSLAGRLAAPGHVREVVKQIEDLNSLPGPGLQVGQKIAVPVGG